MHLHITFNVAAGLAQPLAYALAGALATWRWRDANLQLVPLQNAVSLCKQAISSARGSNINTHNCNWSGYITWSVCIKSCITLRWRLSTRSVCVFADGRISGYVDCSSQEHKGGRARWYTYYAHTHTQSRLYLDHWCLRKKNSHDWLLGLFNEQFFSQFYVWCCGNGDQIVHPRSNIANK